MDSAVPPSTPPRNGAAAASQTPPSRGRSRRLSKERQSTAIYASCVCLLLWLALFVPLQFVFSDVVPLWMLTVYDVVLAGLGVLVRAVSSAKTGALPFWHACSRLKHGNARGFMSWLLVVQAFHLHVCARCESYVPRMVSALLTTVPWWMDRRGGWTIVLRGASSFSEIVNDQQHNTSTLSLLLSHVIHLHGLFHGLNLTAALALFIDQTSHYRVVALPHFRLYFVCINLSCAADVLLQPLVDRRLLMPRALPVLLGASVVPAALFALPVLAEHVSVQGAIFSFALWWAREHRAFSNLALAMGFSQLFEVVSLLASRYSLVDV